MTAPKAGPGLAAERELLAADADFLRPLARTLVQEALEAEVTVALGAAKGGRTAARLGYRSGYDARGLVTRVGKLELRVPRDRVGRFATELFERDQRSEKALVAALAERYVQGSTGGRGPDRSTRKVKTIIEELCGHGFSPGPLPTDAASG